MDRGQPAAPGLLPGPTGGQACPASGAIGSTPATCSVVRFAVPGDFQLCQALLRLGPNGASVDESSIKRAEFYEHKAAEARAKADGMKDAEARRTMLLVASLWEAMARSARGERSKG
jgi:hypothetical protein